MKDISKQIGKRLLELRKSQGLSQLQLAENIDISGEFIGRVERGISNPSIKTLAIIANKLGVSITEFFEEPENTDSWEVEIEALVILLKNKKGKSVRKVFKLGEVLDE